MYPQTLKKNVRKLSRGLKSLDDADVDDVPFKATHTHTHTPTFQHSLTLYRSNAPAFVLHFIIYNNLI